MLSIRENTPEIKCKKKYQKMEFFLKHLTRDHPKKYQLSTDDYFFVFSISMWRGGGAMPPWTRVCRLTRMQQYFGT